MRDVVQIVERACAAEGGVQAAIVFGSALESESPGDVDLAILWPPATSDADRWRRANRIASAVEHELADRDLGVDVKDLRALPLVLQHRVLQTGRVACAPDRRALVRFTSETVPVALDFLPAYRRMLRESARRLAQP